MHRLPKRFAAAASAAVLVLALAACSSPPAPNSTPIITPVPTTSPEPTSSVVATDSTSATPTGTGPISTPASGSSTRAAILDAASKGLHVSGGITVYQLFVQGGTAVGDILPSSGSRTFFALTGGPKAWKLVWSAKFGSSLANADAIVSADAAVSAQLAAKLDFTKVAAKTPTTTKSTAAPSPSSFQTFARKSATTFAGGSFTGTFTIEARIAKSSDGSWWGNALVSPGDDSLEPIGVWGRYVAGKWKGQIADFSTDNAEAGFFPADVISKLEL
jgi:hypothetical protein